MNKLSFALFIVIQNQFVFSATVDGAGTLVMVTQPSLGGLLFWSIL